LGCLLPGGIISLQLLFGILALLCQGMISSISCL
jgi:hypothetical protein